MNRKGFVARVLAALGAFATGPPIRPWASKDVPVSTPTSPPAPPFPSILELRRQFERHVNRFSHRPTHFYCNSQTLLDLTSTIRNVGDYSCKGKHVTVIGMRWVESGLMEDGQLWAGGAPWEWKLPIVGDSAPLDREVWRMQNPFYRRTE